MAAFLTLLDRPTLYNETTKVKTQLKKPKKNNITIRTLWNAYLSDKKDSHTYSPFFLFV